MWTKKDKEWQGYKRKMSIQDKSSITLSTPPWENKSTHEFEVRPIIERTLPLLSSEIDIS